MSALPEDVQVWAGRERSRPSTPQERFARVRERLGVACGTPLRRMRRDQLVRASAELVVLLDHLTPGEAVEDVARELERVRRVGAVSPHMRDGRVVLALPLVMLDVASKLAWGARRERLARAAAAALYALERHDAGEADGG